MNSMHRILVLDSSGTTREWIVELLEKEGYQTNTVDPELFAQPLLADNIPDLIVCESESPGYTRYKLVQNLRKDPATGKTPIIITSEINNNQEIQKAIQSGADDFILKPIDPDKLLISIKVQLYKQNITGSGSSTAAKSISRLLSHELRTPLVAILGFSEMLSERMCPPVSAECSDLIAGIRSAGTRLLGFVGKYSKFIETESIRNNPTLKAHLREACVAAPTAIIYETCYSIAQKHNRQEYVIFELREGSSPGTIENLRLIVSELAENACKYSPPETPITVKSYTRENSFFMELENYCDTDPEDESQKLLALHYPANLQFSLTSAGMGISIANNLASIHHGQVTVRSSAPKKICVTVELHFQNSEL